MIKIEEPHKRHKECIACNNKQDLKKISLGKNENQYTSIVVCHNCIHEIYHRILPEIVGEGK